MTSLSSLFVTGGIGVVSGTNLTDNALVRGADGSRGVQTTPIIVSDDGEMTNPSQPSFMCIGSTQDNIAVGTGVTIEFGTEAFDQGNDFNIATYTFTAPITGKYQLSTNVRFSAIDIAATYYFLRIVTSNRSYTAIFDPQYFSADVGIWSLHISITADMDANDTAYVQMHQASGTQQTDITADSTFSGALIC